MMTTSASSEELCGVCQSNREAHVALNHEFNLQGQLIPKKPVKPKGQPGSTIEVMIAFNRLITLLHQKGLLTDEDIMFLATGVQHEGAPFARPSAGSDMEAGPGTTTD